MGIREILDSLESSLIIKGDATHAYRDPAVIYEDGVFHIFMTLVETEADGAVYMYVAKTVTRDFKQFTPIKKLTVRDRKKNFSSPGNIILTGGRYLMCLQSYCRENGEKYGNENSRIYFSESRDLEAWGEPYPVMLKGDKPISELGRMIDPYLIYDECEGLWNCFYKQNGVSRSVSRDLIHFEYVGRADAGENVSILKTEDTYLMLHSPENGIGVKRSTDLCTWEDVGEPLTLGQAEWEWARGRITAATLAAIDDGGVPIYLMLFHGTGPEDERVIFDTHASIGVAWSFDLKNWIWK